MRSFRTEENRFPVRRETVADMKINLDVQSLRSFMKVAELRSFTRAAEVLNMTQPAISQQIRRLEELLGVDLFIRDNRNVLLTLDGEKLLSYANDIVCANDQVGKIFATSQHRTVVTIGVPEHFCETILPKIISRMTMSLPDVQIVVKVARSVLITEAVDEGRVDLGLVIDEADRIQELPWQSISVRWFASDKVKFGLKNNVPLALFKPPCGFRSLAIRSLEKCGIGWRCAYESEDLLSLRSAVVAGAGVTVLPFLAEVKGLKSLEEVKHFPDLPRFAVALRQRPGWNPAFKQEIMGIVRNVWTEEQQIEAELLSA